jgi:hypothetical protein
MQVAKVLQAEQLLHQVVIPITHLQVMELSLQIQILVSQFQDMQ